MLGGPELLITQFISIFLGKVFLLYRKSWGTENSNESFKVTWVGAIQNPGPSPLPPQQGLVRPDFPQGLAGGR